MNQHFQPQITSKSLVKIKNFAKRVFLSPMADITVLAELDFYISYTGQSE
jgi:hypothetical protein